MLNWSHREYKGLVLLGIPQDSDYQVWREPTEKDKFDTGYYIDNSFVFGIMDMNDLKIELNPNFQLEHNYDDMIEDWVYAKSLKGYKTIVKNHNTKDSSTENENLAGEQIFNVDDNIQRLQELADSDMFSFTDEMFNTFINLQRFAKEDKWFRESEVSDLLKEAKIFAKVMFDNMHRLPEVIDSESKSTSFDNGDEDIENTVTVFDHEIEWY